MATQQRSVIVTAIVLAIILGGALVWLLNRTPAEQLATQVPEAQGPGSINEPAAGSELITVEEANRLAQAPQQQAPTQTGISPTDTQQLPQAEPGAVQGVAATAPTGTRETMMALAVASVALGGGGLLALSFPGLKRFGR